jgi:hypothetical protein
VEVRDIAREITSLPPEVQRQVIDFVAFLKIRYQTGQPTKRIKQTRLADEPFIGMWRDREDMQDSTTWVHNLREREWGRRT